MSDSLWPHGLQHIRPLCLSPTPEVYSNSSPLSWWCHPTIPSSFVPSSPPFQSFPASGSFPMSQFFTSGGQSIGVSASASVLPMNIQDWCPLGWTGWISSQSRGLSTVFSNTAVQKHQFLSSLKSQNKAKKKKKLYWTQINWKESHYREGESFLEEKRRDICECERGRRNMHQVSRGQGKARRSSNRPSQPWQAAIFRSPTARLILPICQFCWVGSCWMWAVPEAEGWAGKAEEEFHNLSPEKIKASGPESLYHLHWESLLCWDWNSPSSLPILPCKFSIEIFV